MQQHSSREIIQMNRNHWNAVAVRDWPKRMKTLRMIRDGYPYLERTEPKIAPYLRDIKNKKIVVLQFGDAFVLLACAKKGAIVTGVDFSPEQVKLAREAAAYCGVDVRLVKANCQRLAKRLPDSSFDLAVAECGIFIWIENLNAWMRNAYGILKNRGKLVVSDFHPLSIITREKDNVLSIDRSYFDKGPKICQEEENVPPSSEFLWKLSDIINSATHAGFQIENVEEYNAKNQVKGAPLIPTDFLLVATKKNKSIQQ